MHLRFFKHLREKRQNVSKPDDATIPNNTGFLSKFRKASSIRRQERAEIAKHRKWSFISMAVIAICALIFYLTGGISTVITSFFGK